MTKYSHGFLPNGELKFSLTPNHNTLNFTHSSWAFQTLFHNSIFNGFPFISQKNECTVLTFDIQFSIINIRRNVFSN